jgi:hypothetical protein
VYRENFFRASAIDGWLAILAAFTRLFVAGYFVVDLLRYSYTIRYLLERVTPRVSWFHLGVCYAKFTNPTAKMSARSGSTRATGLQGITCLGLDCLPWVIEQRPLPYFSHEGEKALLDNVLM